MSYFRAPNPAFGLNLLDRKDNPPLPPHQAGKVFRPNGATFPHGQRSVTVTKCRTGRRALMICFRAAIE